MTVLYDAPGPRTRRYTLIASIISFGFLLAGAYRFVYQPLEKNNQFSSKLWGPLIDPDNKNFSPLWRYLGEGFQATLIAALSAIIASLIVGTGIAVLRVQLRSLRHQKFVSKTPIVSWPLRGLALVLNGFIRIYIEIFRGIPVVITIVFVWVVLPQHFNIHFDDALWYLVIGLTVYNSVVIGEILRSGMEGLPRGQNEAAQAIGLTPFQTIWHILLPQALRIMLPALISQLVVILKDTSLGFIISYEETLRVSGFIVQTFSNPIQVYAVVGIIFIIVNYLLSRLAQYVQKSIARGRRMDLPNLSTHSTYIPQKNTNDTDGTNSIIARSR